MSSAVRVEVGTLLPIMLQLGDGNLNVFPQASIWAASSGLVATLDMLPAPGGLYSTTEPFVMPDDLFVVAVYTVYADVNHGEIATRYQRDKDTFSRVDPTESGAAGTPEQVDVTMDDEFNIAIITDDYDVAISIE